LLYNVEQGFTIKYMRKVNTETNNSNLIPII